MASEKAFDGAWNLQATLRKDGSVENATPETIAAARLILIRDELRKRGGIAAIADALGWSGYLVRELRGLRRDMKQLANSIRSRRRCRRRHA